MTNSTAFDLRTLIESEIPDGRQSLEASYANLERVAAYCEANYLQASDKQGALEETRRYTVQSLASVAYQVNTLASNLLQMLDLQADKIAGMESQVTNIAQIVDIHKEKVARREIGVLTTNKSLPRQHKIITPIQQEKPQRYIRRQIDYSILDELGHGVKLQSHSGQIPRFPQQPLDRTASSVSGGSSGSGSDAISYPMSRGTLNAKDFYRTPAVVTSPPSAPQAESRYSDFTGPQQGTLNYQQQSVQYRSIGKDNYNSPVSMDQQRISQINSYGSWSQGTEPSPGVPPPMHPISTEPYRLSAGGNNNGAMTGSTDGLPPPPSPSDFHFNMGYPAQYSPPLPPPPMDESVEDAGPDFPRYMGRSNRNSVPDWVPGDFLEKVIAIYDYQAEKADELTFEENSVIYVLKKNEDGWYEGVMDGMTGLFPGNYVESCM